MPYGLDDIDRAILYYLSEDARNNSAPDIAEHVRVSAQTVRNRIDQLEENGVIQGYHAQIDFERAEGLLTNIYMCKTGVEDRATLAHQALQIPGVVNVREIMTGETDLRIVAVGKDTDEITRIARAISDLGVDIKEEDLVRREHMSPFRRFSPQDTLQGPTVSDFLTLTGGASIVEVTVSEGAPIVGETLRAAKQEGLLNEDVLIVSIQRDGAMLTPTGDSTIEGDDTVTVLSRHDIGDDLDTAFTGSEEETA